MAQFLHVSWTFHANRQALYRLLTDMLIGSLCGALCAKLHAPGLSAVDFGMKQTSWILIWLRSALFPCLMAVSFLLRRRYLFSILFFLKGAFAAYCLCAFALFGADRLLFALPALAFQSLLPLPLYFYAASVWLGEEDSSGRPLFFLAPMLLISLLGALIQVSLVT